MKCNIKISVLKQLVIHLLAYGLMRTQVTEVNINLSVLSAILYKRYYSYKILMVVYEEQLLTEVNTQLFKAENQSILSANLIVTIVAHCVRPF